jgi:hypothetical protein
MQGNFEKQHCLPSENNEYVFEKWRNIQEQ